LSFNDGKRTFLLANIGTIVTLVIMLVNGYISSIIFDVNGYNQIPESFIAKDLSAGKSEILIKEWQNSDIDCLNFDITSSQTKLRFSSDMCYLVEHCLTVKG
jgi:hypothetical protein